MREKVLDNVLLTIDRRVAASEVFSDEMPDITRIQSFRLLLQILKELLADSLGIADDKINVLVDTFMDVIPVLLKTKLQAI
ncbi:MAG: hypothetical protein HFI45_16700 [Lachnospiraceae bacterium]|nr:hypothetical protein [Lachnospiraceae bacterium]